MADVTTTIDTSSIKADVKKVLSLVGKRSGDKQGNTLFASVTLSSAEEALIDTFVEDGTHLFISEVAPIVTGGTSGTSVTLTLDASRVNGTKLDLFEKNAIGFIKNFALKKAFDASGQEEQSKNADATMQQHLDSAIKLVFCKDSPATNTTGWFIAGNATL